MRVKKINYLIVLYEGSTPSRGKRRRCNRFQCVTHKYIQTFTNVNKLCLHSFVFQVPINMPKEGLSSLEWRRCLHAFPTGDQHLGQGQRPKRDMHWVWTLEGIERCPKHRSIISHDPYGRSIQCNCGFHRSTAPPAPNLATHTRHHAPILLLW